MKNIITSRPYLVLIAALFGVLSANALPWDSYDEEVPIIGIITTPSDGEDSDSYIHMGYVDFVEAGGAKAVPIPWNLDSGKFDTLIESVNGLLFTGDYAELWEEEYGRKRGDHHTKFSEYQEKLNSIVDLVREKADDGDHFPLYAIGRGFESVALAVTRDPNLLRSYKHEGRMDKVYFTNEGQKSTMFQDFTQGSFEFLQHNDAMYYDHNSGLNSSVMSLYPQLKLDKWVITAISDDDNSRPFYTAMESKKYPISMVMFHPQQVLYEANHDPSSTHKAGAILACKLMARSFVDEARKNDNTFDKELLNALQFKNFDTEDWGDESYYIVGRYYVEEKWNEGPVRFIKLIVLIALILGGICLYNRYRRSKGMPEITYKSFVADGTELTLKPKNDKSTPLI